MITTGDNGQKNEFQMTKTTRIVVGCFIAFAMALPLGLGLLANLTGGPSGVEALSIEASNEILNCKVDSIYRDNRNHNVEMLVLSNGQLYKVWTEWERKIELGDSLSKKAGIFILEVHKKSGSKVILNYKDIFKDFK
jgi:hypothetical protein